MDIDVRRVLDSLGDPLLALDGSARILHANTGLRELLGWSRRELIGRPLSLVLPDGLPGEPREGPAAPSGSRSPAPSPRARALSQAMDEEEAAYGVLRACGETEGWVLGTYWRRGRPDGALGHQLGRFLDRCHLGERERTRQGALRRLWDADLLGLFVSDAHGRLLDANATLLRMLGYSRRDVREGRLTWPLMTPARHRTATERSLRRLRADGAFHSFEGRGLESLGFKPGRMVGLSVFDIFRTEPNVLAHVRRALAGEELLCVEALTTGLLFETHWVPLHDAEGHVAGTLGLAVDVTQREREARWRAELYAEAEQARAEAEQAVRMRDEFLTVASHELKTPLTSLNLQLHTLLKQARQGQRPEDRELVERLEKARRQLQKLARMMDDLLDVSRVTDERWRLELGEVDLLRVVHDVLERFEEEARRAGTHLEARGTERRW